MSMSSTELIFAASPGDRLLRTVPIAAPRLSWPSRGGLFLVVRRIVYWSSDDVRLR